MRAGHLVADVQPLQQGVIVADDHQRCAGCAGGIDQHFAQRKRFSDMEKFSSTYPNFIGVGIDEATALIVTAKGAEALGPGKVHVYKNGKALSSHASGERVNLSP